MSSIEPDDCGGKVDCGEEIARGFVISRRDCPIEFEFAEEIFDEMSGLVGVVVVIAKVDPIGFRRNDGSPSCVLQLFQHALISIIGFIGQQGVGDHSRQQDVCAVKVMRLTAGKMKGQRVAEGIDQRMDFRAQPAPTAPDGLRISFFWAPRRCADGRGRWCCRASRIRCPHHLPSH